MSTVLAVMPCVDEARQVVGLVRAMPRQVTRALVIDDGSTDGTGTLAREAGAEVLRFERTRGVGAALRAGFQFALVHGFEVVVVLAGNGKDDPAEIPALLEPIDDGTADFVQGSRWLKREPELGAMPRYRKLATRLHPLLFTLATGHFVTESTNGFRALHRRIFGDPLLGLDGPHLDGYQLEPFLYARALALGYRAVEVPVRKIYPQPTEGPVTRMKPISGWWQMLSPLVRAVGGRSRFLL
jgi:dolichol-phosphate mannosyltransferase